MYYFWNPETFEYTGSVPGSGNPIALPPENSSTIPPSFQDGYAAFWNPDVGNWRNVEDHRGEEGWVNGERFTINDVGPYPDGWSSTEPPPPPPTDLEVIQGIESQYMKSLDILRQSYTIATLQGNTDDATAISGEYTAMLGRMKVSIENRQIRNGVSTTRCKYCGKFLVETILNDESIAMQCPDCGYTVPMPE